MKIYEDFFNNQYTEDELEIVKNEDSDFVIQLYDVFHEFLTLDNFMECLFALSEDIQEKVKTEATRQYYYGKDIKEIADIDIDENILKKGRRIGDRIIDIPSKEG